jgi:membrane-bound lytic murein transglycosylase D
LDFIPVLKAAFAAEGLPRELAWVAEVESSWATNAVSRSGARGLYQFKPEAAKRFALLQETRDFRTEPEPSARAAARYLAQLYSQFGDWRLALAAYNAGEGCVSRLLKSRRARSYDEIAAYLPPQTQVYVIKVMSIVSIREATTLSALPGPRLIPIGN